MRFAKHILIAISIAIALIAPASSVAESGDHVPGKSELLLGGYPDYGDIEGDDFYYTKRPGSKGESALLQRRNLMTGSTDTVFTAAPYTSISRVTVHSGEITFMLHTSTDASDIYTAMAVNTDGTEPRTLIQTELKSFRSGPCGSEIVLATPTERQSEIVGVQSYVNTKRTSQCPANLGPSGRLMLIETRSGAPATTIFASLPRLDLTSLADGDNSWGASANGLKLAYTSGAIDQSPRSIQMVDVAQNTVRSWRVGRPKSFDTVEVSDSGRVIGNIFSVRSDDAFINRFIMLREFGRTSKRSTIASRDDGGRGQASFCGEQTLLWSDYSPSQLYWSTGRRHGKPRDDTQEVFACNEKWFVFYSNSGNRYFTQRLALVR